MVKKPMSATEVKAHLDRIREKAKGAKRKMPAASHFVRLIRRYCIECMGGALAEVERCSARRCLLYPHRMGLTGVKDPENYDLGGGEGHGILSLPSAPTGAK